MNAAFFRAHLILQNIEAFLPLGKGLGSGLEPMNATVFPPSPPVPLPEGEGR